MKKKNVLNVLQMIMMCIPLLFCITNLLLSFASFYSYNIAINPVIKYQIKSTMLVNLLPFCVAILMIIAGILMLSKKYVGERILLGIALFILLFLFIVAIASLFYLKASMKIPFHNYHLLRFFANFGIFYDKHIYFMRLKHGVFNELYIWANVIFPFNYIISISVSFVISLIKIIFCK